MRCIHTRSVSRLLFRKVAPGIVAFAANVETGVNGIAIAAIVASMASQCRATVVVQLSDLVTPLPPLLDIPRATLVVIE